MKLHDDPITTLTTTGKYVESNVCCRVTWLNTPLLPSFSLLVSGDGAGRVKFFSSELKLLHWYDVQRGSGPLVSISVAHTTPVKENTTEYRYGCASTPYMYVHIDLLREASTPQTEYT